MQANSKNFSYSRNLFFDILAYIKNNAYLCSENIINNVSHNFCFNGARRCETMGIFYCLIVDIYDIIETVVNIKYIVNKFGNFVKGYSIDFYYDINIDFSEGEKEDFYYLEDVNFNDEVRVYTRFGFINVIKLIFIII